MSDPQVQTLAAQAGNSKPTTDNQATVAEPKSGKDLSLTLSGKRTTPSLRVSNAKRSWQIVLGTGEASGCFGGPSWQERKTGRCGGVL